MNIILHEKEGPEIGHGIYCPSFLLEGTNCRITEAEDRVSEVEDRMVEINE